MQANLDIPQLRESIASAMYENCTGASWSAAPPMQRALFLTSANVAIRLVLEAFEDFLGQDGTRCSIDRPLPRLPS